jgi:uncharacterized membrane protein
MILYNTVVGLAGGVGLLLVSQLLKQFANADTIQPEGFALAFGITGFIQTVLGLTISVMWPYTKVLHANIMMGEPALVFGLLLLAAAFFLWRKSDAFVDLGRGPEKSAKASAYLISVLRPVSVWIFAAGLMMVSLVIAIVYYQLGQAPPQEPISGYFADSWVEPIFLALLWGLIALGALFTPFALLKWNRKIVNVTVNCWSVAGVLLVLSSAMNYFTHIGLLMNTSDSL